MADERLTLNHSPSQIAGFKERFYRRGMERTPAVWVVLQGKVKARCRSTWFHSDARRIPSAPAEGIRCSPFQAYCSLEQCRALVAFAHENQDDRPSLDTEDGKSKLSRGDLLSRPLPKATKKTSFSGRTDPRDSGHKMYLH